MRGIEAAGFTDCTPIQASTLPIALSGRDIAGQAQTGTGKTAAFLIAVYSHLLRSQPPKRGRTTVPRALVIAPTRELAIQIRDEASLLGRFTGLSTHAVYGGIDYKAQLERFKEPVDLLIGTPGRLIDYFKQKAFSLRTTEMLVVDEADRMFDMGFIDDIRFLLRRMPPPDKRKSYLYSATLPYKVMELAYEHMDHAERVTVAEERKTADNVEHVVYHVGQHEKLATLLCMLEDEAPSRALIFVNTRRMAQDLSTLLEAMGFDAMGIAGDVDQKKRLRVLKRLKDDHINILVATDVASRGLHIDNVSHVFNYDLPQDPEDYVHRIGRTARAGASGRALSLACEEYVYSLDEIESFIGFKIDSTLPDEKLLGRIEEKRDLIRKAKSAARRAARKAPKKAAPRRKAGAARDETKSRDKAPKKEAGNGSAGTRRKRRRRTKKRGGDSPA